jgi:hypothetical protein
MVPSVVWKFVTTGFAVRLQQRPLTVTVEPPLAVIFPPETAEVKTIVFTAVVVRVGTDAAVVVNGTSAP